MEAAGINATALLRRQPAVLVAALCCAALCWAVTGAWTASAQADTQISLRTVGAAAFVPNWDGESDAASVSLRGSGPVDVVVVDRRGRRIRSLASGLQTSSAASTISWDGVTDAGRVAPVGSYEIVVCPSGPTVCDGTNARGRATVRVLAPAVSVTTVSVSNGMVGLRGAKSHTRVAYRMSKRGAVSAAVMAANGTVVRTLARGVQKAGLHTLAWNGRGVRNRRLPDGIYTVIVAASAGALPSDTVSATVRVDTHAPKLRIARSADVGRAARGRIWLRMPITGSEAGTLRITASGRKRGWHRAFPAGRTVLKLTARQLGMRAQTKARTAHIVVQLTDQAGNIVRHKLAVQLPSAHRVQRSLKVHATAPKKGSSSAAAAHTPAPPTSTTTASSTAVTHTTTTTSAGGSLAAGSLLWPAAGIITSPFGQRTRDFHEGVDIAGPNHQPIHAAINGVVSFAGQMSGYGNLVMIDSPGGIQTRYAHLATIEVVTGQIMTRGETLGLEGMTGDATGPHCHFEVRINGIAKNPVLFLPPGPPAS